MGDLGHPLSPSLFESLAAQINAVKNRSELVMDIVFWILKIRQHGLLGECVQPARRRRI